MKTRASTLTPPVPAPAHLSEAAKHLWDSVAARKQISEGRQALLQSALEALDRANECREILAKEGLVKTTERTGAVHIHPLAKLECECRRQFATIWSGQLSLHFDVQVDGRL
jgi:phage terminase small subunit